MKNEPMPSEAKDFGPFYQGTKADLQPGDLLEPGYDSNFGERRKANYLYLTATLGGATRGAELAVGEVLDWESHPPEALQDMRSHLDELKRLGIEAIND